MASGRITKATKHRKRKIRSEGDLAPALLEWFAVGGRDLPWRRTTDPYAVLVSEFMLQQTQVATVLPYYERWMRTLPDVCALAAASEEDVLGLWQGLGYYSRARNLQRTAVRILEDHAGLFPHDIHLLQKLPGVGPYTAAAVASFAFDLPEPLVDTNVARVLARLDNIREPIDGTSGRRAIWASAARLLPAGSSRLFNSAIMELGALVCVSGKPKCHACPLVGWCRSEDPESLPVKRPKPSVERLIERRAFFLKDGNVWLEQEHGSRWRGLWRLPVSRGGGAPRWSGQYAITRYQVRLEVFDGLREEFPDSGEGRWVGGAALAAIPMPSPHRKAVQSLLDQKDD